MTAKRKDAPLVIGAYEAGMPLAVIAERYGFTNANTVGTFLWRHRVPARKKPTSFKTKIVERLDAGASRAEIAAELGCSLKWVDEIAQRTGHHFFKRKRRS